jgi:hypothetical protein
MRIRGMAARAYTSLVPSESLRQRIMSLASEARLCGTGDQNRLHGIGLALISLAERMLASDAPRLDGELGALHESLAGLESLCGTENTCSVTRNTYAQLFTVVANGILRSTVSIGAKQKLTLTGSGPDSRRVGDRNRNLTI